MPTLTTTTLNQLFLEARTHNKWLDTPVDEALLRELYGLTKFAPTSANSQPMRLVFVTSPEAKERLKPTLATQNVGKTMTAPVTAKVDAAFFPDGTWRSNFLVNLGYGDRAGLRPRNPRLDFDEACRIV
jgi:hypothetical protein